MGSHNTQQCKKYNKDNAKSNKTATHNTIAIIFKLLDGGVNLLLTQHVFAFEMFYQNNFYQQMSQMHCIIIFRQKF